MILFLLVFLIYVFRPKGEKRLSQYTPTYYLYDKVNEVKYILLSNNITITLSFIGNLNFSFPHVTVSGQKTTGS